MARVQLLGLPYTFVSLGFQPWLLSYQASALRDAKVTGVPWKVGCAADFGFGGDGADCIGTAVAVGAGSLAGTAC